MKIFKIISLSSILSYVVEKLSGFETLQPSKIIEGEHWPDRTGPDRTGPIFSAVIPYGSWSSFLKGLLYIHRTDVSFSLWIDINQCWLMEKKK